MSFQKKPAPDLDLAQLIEQVVAKKQITQNQADQRWLLVDAHQQRLVLVLGRTPQQSWPVSTAAAGLDNRQDSGGTPPGTHRIARKIGAGRPLGTIFRSREATGELWQPGPETEDDLILTRILTLTGCEPGLNQGPGVDSEKRYIYLHGTNDEARLGEAVSHGCVRLSNAHICEVFDLIAEGDPVVIV